MRLDNYISEFFAISLPISTPNTVGVIAQNHLLNFDATQHLTQRGMSCSKRIFILSRFAIGQFVLALGEDTCLTGAANFRIERGIDWLDPVRHRRKKPARANIIQLV